MNKRAPLVCQQLENISREALGRYQDIVRQYVRRRHGVYDCSIILKADNVLP
jgi:hypothetical protein